MVSLQKMICLAKESRFDALDQGASPGIDLSKLYALGDATKHDVCVSSATTRVVSGLDRLGDVTRAGVCHSFSHDGRCVSMFKTLFTNECSHQCAYCSNSTVCTSSKEVYCYEPQELANIMLQLYRGNYVEGLFLSSGIGKDEDRTMERMLEATRLLREKHHFAGYVHLKILPGTDRDHVGQAMEFADRVSVNIEVPSSDHMSLMSPTKDYRNDILRRQRYVQRLARKKGLPAGQTTQLVVGGAGESDMEIFGSMVREYREYDLKRVYFSAFLPVEGTPLETTVPQPKWREHRLYQLDWLYRVYHMPPDELRLAFDAEDRLCNNDPKATIAKETITEPLDPNEASYDQLLRVPGIGQVSAKRIVSARRTKRFSTRKELHYLGVRLKRANPYLKVGGWQESLLERWMK
ncbi:MAG: putative DNA modification/repair radical SAM protein [Candidatus Methanofastidiosa archaeon]|nr:putative DNA modification/repair radical SAM protein [Candidatus Methanofastidiosa archaeon]